MVRILVLAQCVCVVLLCLVCPACAQTIPTSTPPVEQPQTNDDPPGKAESPRRSESKEREAFFDALREFIPHKELFDLVEDADICDEIGLSAADAAKIDQNVRQAFDAIHKLRRENSGKNIAPDEYKRQVRKAIEPFNKASYEILKNANLDRLLGLYAQARSYRAVLHEQIADKIELQGEAFERFRKKRNEIWEALMEEAREEMIRELRNAPPGALPGREDIAKHFKKIEEKLDFKLSFELTPQQKVALEQLKGAAFNLPENPFNFGPPPGRGRGGRSEGSGRGPDHDERNQRDADGNRGRGDAQDSPNERDKCCDHRHPTPLAS